MSGKAGLLPRLLLLLFVTSLVLVACSSDETTTAPTESGPVIKPLASSDWPMEDGNWWTFIRVLKTEPLVFGIIGYQDYNLQMAAELEWDDETPLDFLYSPYIHIELDGTVETGSGSAQVMRGTRSSELMGEGTIINQNELWTSKDASGIHYLGENFDAADDSLFWDGSPCDLVHFGETRWTKVLEDFTGTDEGMVSMGEAVGFGAPIDIDFDSPPNDPERFWPDSLYSYSLVHKMAGVTDVDYDSRFSYGEIDYFPVLADTIIEDCKWLMQGIEYDVHLTNQRNPDAGPGESGIPDNYIPARNRRVTVFQPRRLFLLAPDLGPIRIVTYRDLDWMLDAEPITETELEFPPDFMEIDYLLDSNLLP